MRNTEFVEYVKEIFEAIAEVRIKAMFGGYGIYNKQLIIGLIVDNELYLKCDIAAAEYFKSSGSKQLTYGRQGKFIKMSYWQVLPEVLEDIELFTSWYNLAIKSAMRTIKTKIKK